MTDAAPDRSAPPPATTPADFELGLVLAGAISAGAYTAGVLDFLLEALQQVERERNHNKAGVPQGRMKLRVVSGSSAGGMCGGILLGMLARPSEPVVEDPGPSCPNPLFDAWVNRIDIDSLLTSGDLALAPPEELPASLLDCTGLEDIAQDALRMPNQMPSPPPWLADKLDLLLTLTNLRGVPYSIGFPGSSFQHGMLLHADYLHFSLYQTKADTDGEAPYRCHWNNLPQAPWLKLLQQGALASGAFPLTLTPRLLSHPFPSSEADLYSQRRWPRFRFWRDARATDKKAKPPLPEGATTVFGRDRLPLSCHWPKSQVPRPYDFSCLDGGLMNNEPLELARRVLSRDRGSLDSTGETTNRALILIDPFPGGELLPAEYEPPADLIATGLAMFGALKNQARFKPQELLDAMDDGVFSRFVIAPSRDLGGMEIRGERAIAAGALGGFGGFLDRKLRLHDYFLGRRNCQQFLRKHFVLPKEHPLFGYEYRAAWEDNDQIVTKDQKDCLPIIPLLGTAAQDVRVPVFPRLDKWRLDQVMGKVGRRFDALTDRTIEVATHNAPMARLLSRFVRDLKRQDALDSLRRWLEEGLKQHGLLG